MNDLCRCSSPLLRLQTRLCLRDTGITSLGASVLASALNESATLTELDLSWNAIKAVDAAVLLECGSLQDLDLSFNPLCGNTLSSYGGGTHQVSTADLTTSGWSDRRWLDPGAMVP